jgi:hypothetical protein
MGVDGQRHASVTLAPGKRNDTHCIRGWVGPRLVWTGADNLAPPPQTGLCKPVESLYTDPATPTHSITEYTNTIYSRTVESLLNNDLGEKWKPAVWA